MLLYMIQHYSLSYKPTCCRVCLSPHLHWARGECYHTTHLYFCAVTYLFFLPDIFQRAFTADDDYLENHEKMRQSFWESLVKCLATTDPPILNTEEKNNVSYWRNMHSFFVRHSSTDILLYFSDIFWRERTYSPFFDMFKKISKMH